MAVRKDYKALVTKWKRNLRRGYAQWVNQAHIDEGMRWYSEVFSRCQEISQETGYSVDVVCGVVAALSPGCPWERNLPEARSFLLTYTRISDSLMEPKYAFGVYGQKNKAKALRIVEGEHPLDVMPKTGPKVRAFYQCIVAPQWSGAVCIDGHAKGAAERDMTGIDKISVRPAEYPRLAEAYRQVAKEKNLLPSQFQAIIWLAFRDYKNSIRKEKRKKLHEKEKSSRKRNRCVETRW